MVVRESICILVVVSSEQNKHKFNRQKVKVKYTRNRNNRDYNVFYDNSVTRTKIVCDHDH